VVPRVVLGRAASGISCWVLAKASLAFFGVTCLLFKWVPENRLGEFAFAYAAGHWLVAAGVHALRRRRDPLIANLLGLGAIYVTLAIPLYYSADSLAIAWSVQALVFTCIGIWYARWRTLASAAIVFALAVFYTLSHDWWDTEWRGEWGWFDVRFATMAIVAATLGLAGLAYRIGRSRLADLAEWGSPRVPFAWVVLGNAVLILAAMHQFLDNHLALAWAANAVVAAGLAWWRRHILAGWFALVALVPAVLRFLAHQCANVKPEVWQWDIDIRFAQGLLVVAGIWLVAFLVRRRLRWEDLPERSTVALLVGDAMLCVVFALQWEHQTLTAMFALNALALSGFARWRNLHGLAWASVLAFALTAVRWLGWDYGRDEVLAAAPPVLVSFAGGAGLVAAGWMAAAILRGRWGGVVATVLGLGMNLVLLAVIDAQWDRYAMLTLWAVDVAVLWAIGFRFESWASRAEAFLLWVFLLGGWIVFSGFAWQGELADFTVLLNSRFGSLLLVALIGFAASWAYRVKLGRPSSPTPQSMTVVQMLRLSPGEFVAAVPNTAVSERNGDWSCAVLANLLLVTALTMEILTRFDRYRFEGDSPFENWEMARQAALSILWTAYAAAAFIGGFVLRYKPVRLLALISLGPILAKVFLVDLRDLEVIYRVLSFAVLGVVFIGISYLYQRYARRIAPDVP
ncbi:MAG TPA: DUF2339 domain-containing protein, partial [Phycisphaerae bacterium]|nr:DUF2339 domain-containing protein [Phycisphaerae bacterium]